MAQFSGMWTLSQVSQAVKNQTWTSNVPSPPSVIEYLIVAGGGAGFSSGSAGGCGGGGAGGLLAGSTGITVGTSYFVTVGAGAADGSTSNGSASVFDAASSGASTGRIVASGGGSPTTANGPGIGGGSGSGAGESNGSTFLGTGPGISGQGNMGGNSSHNFCGSGGGGAGTAGSSNLSTTRPGNGGSGIASSISGTVTTYAGGGGGAGYLGGDGGEAGIGGGGRGSISSSRTTTPGTVNSGGGGGGRGVLGTGSTAGGSGVVIIRYPGTTQFFTGGTLSYANGYIIHTFYANGTLVPTAPTLYANPDYQIARSLRFNKADAAYLERTPPTAGNQKTWTQSLWVKRSSLGTQQDLYSPYYSANSQEAQFYFNSSDQLGVYDGGGDPGYMAYFTTQLFRDVSAWYHIVVACDTTQATASDRLKIYVNGVQITSFTTSQTHTQNLDTGWNGTSLQRIGSYARHTTATLDGYMAEFYNIDGLALTPSSFGWTNPATGVWSPLDYVGSYGTNGFYVNFSDNSNITAATLGADSSGNGNNWTPNNFSVSAGAGNDSLVDTPTSYGTDTGVGGEVRGNYATFSPLYLNGGGVTASSYTNGNLQIDFSASGGGHGSSTISVSSGKWYSEFTLTAASSAYATVGIRLASTVNDSSYAPGSTAGSYGYVNDGTKSSSGTATSYGASFTVNDVIGVALDLDAGTLVFYKNGASQGTAFTGISGTFLLAVGDGSTGGTHTFVANFGQRPFAYTAPSGFKALNTQNLPTPTIGATAATLASEFFDTSTWAANGDNVNPRNITSNVDLASGGGLIWAKGRDLAVSHLLVDSVRGYTKYIASNASTAEDTYNFGIAGTTNGFTFTTSSGSLNQLPYNYVGWQWKAGGTAVTNTSGSITTTVSANPTSGFSIATYTGTGSAATIGHGLGVAPNLVIVKKRSGATAWQVYSKVLGRTKVFYLELANAPDTGTNYWGTSDPTSTVFGLGTDGSINASGDSYLAYFFADVAGYSAFGSFTGNGSGAGPFVHLGFRPAFVMIKRSSSTGDWFVYNNKTSSFNTVDKYNVWNSSGAEGTYATLDFLSNGFKLKVSDLEVNGSGSTMIYMAFAENPFKYSLAR